MLPNFQRHGSRVDVLAHRPSISDNGHGGRARPPYIVFMMQKFLTIFVLVVCSSAMHGAGAEQTRVPSFRNEVQPLLMAAGCSSGACHGAAAGKNGFRLS